MFVAGVVATIAILQVYDPGPAKAILLNEKRTEQKKRIEALKERLRAKRLQEQFKGPDILGSGNSKVPQPPSKAPFSNVFEPGNLGETDPNAKPKDVKTPQSPGKGISVMYSIQDR